MSRLALLALALALSGCNTVDGAASGYYGRSGDLGTGLSKILCERPATCRDLGGRSVK